MSIPPAEPNKSMLEGSHRPPGDSGQSERGENDRIELMYRLSGNVDSVGIRDLSEAMVGLANIIEESYKAIYPPSGEKIEISVKPFKEGSFLMDLVLSVQDQPGLLFFAAVPEAISQIKQTLEYIGFIQKASNTMATVIDVIRFLRNGKPSKVTQASAVEFRYENTEGDCISVGPEVHKLINHGTINISFYNAVAKPLERTGATSLVTYIKDDPQGSSEIDRSAIEAMRSFSHGADIEEKEEIIENVTTELLKPKSGTYGETQGKWVFTRAGRKGQLKAKITDTAFLKKFENGLVRFYHGDILKVILKEVQTARGNSVSTEAEVIEVVEYRPGLPRVI